MKTTTNNPSEFESGITDFQSVTWETWGLRVADAIGAALDEVETTGVNQIDDGLCVECEY